MKKIISHHLGGTPEEKKKVTELLLSSQNLEQFPSDIALYENLEILDISNNKINDIPPQIGLLPKLKKVNASHNWLRDFPFCPNLEHLNLEDNQFTQVPEAIYRMPLVYLNLSNNQLSGFIPHFKIKEQLVTHLDLSSNALTTMHGFIHYYKKLRTLNLADNKIRLIPKGIQHAQKMEHLILRKNRIKKVSKEIGACESLNRLDLYDNHIQVLPPGIASVKSLHRLDLGRNKMKHFPYFLHQLPSLFNLNLNHNKLKEIIIGSPFKMLSDLDVSDNQISVLKVEEDALPNLRTLVISNNKIKELPPHLLRNLFRLDAFNNQLTSISDTEKNIFKNLEKLNLRNNRVADLQGDFPRLKTLHLGKNPCRLKLPDVVTFCPSLVELSGKASFDIRKVLHFLSECRSVGEIEGAERLELFQLSAKKLIDFSDKELYSALCLGQKRERLALAFIRQNKGVSLVKNRIVNARLFLLGAFHFNHAYFFDKLKKTGVNIVGSLDEKPTHFIMGSKISKYLFMDVLQYAEQEKVSFLEETIFFDKYLKDSVSYKTLLNTPEMQDNLARLLKNRDGQNQLLGLQMLLSIGLPKQGELKHIILEIFHAAISQEIKELAKDILVLNGIPLN